MTGLWVPPQLRCRICGRVWPVRQRSAYYNHMVACARAHEGELGEYREGESYGIEGDPELRAFAREEGDVYNRRPGTRRRPR